ncbi:MAG: cupin domain-containing protein [bacterium]
MNEPYPDMIRRLPRADIPLDGVVGRLLQAGGHQVVFFEIEPIGAIPPHAHGDQWGVVLEGDMELTIGAETRTYRRGDTYFVPAGVTHSATFRTRFRALDVFGEPDRYQEAIGE